MKRLSLTSLFIIAATAMAVAKGNVPAAGTAMTFDADTKYSRLVIDSRMNDFYANTTHMGFAVYNDKGEKKADRIDSKNTLDYVPGLVAKAIIEAADYYKGKSWAHPWFMSVEEYGNTYAENVATQGGSLDDLNAVKLYFNLQDLTAPGAVFASHTDTYTKTATALDMALTGLIAHNDKYSIAEGDCKGGWWHKKSYPNQMWCDGQYMGPALLAQLINRGKTVTGSADGDWNLITSQFTMTWNKLWDKDKQLLFHAFSTTPADKYANCWADPATGISQEYWGRAEGWYFLALVDVLEQMQNAGLSATDNFQTLKGYLNEIAVGLKRWQDKESGCWYQLLAHDGSFYAEEYQGKSFTRTYNYLESSATAIFIATYLKGMRLGYFDDDYTDVAVKAYKGFVNRFMVADGNGGVHLIYCCRSAGLGGSAKRDGSAAYYLLGSDVTMTNNLDRRETEGKVLGAFILAATEYERRF